jgi:hypothetical protein
MLSLLSRQSFLSPPALFPTTHSLAVVEAAVSGLEGFMAAGFGPPTSGAGLCMLGDMLACPVPSRAAR